MEEKLFIFILGLGFLLYLFFLKFWFGIFSQSTQDRPNPMNSLFITESIGFFFIGIAIYLVLFTNGNVFPIPKEGIPYATLGFGVYFVFMGRFLQKEPFAVRLMYFVLIAIVQIWILFSVFLRSLEITPIGFYGFSYFLWILYGYLYLNPSISIDPDPYPSSEPHWDSHPYNLNPTQFFSWFLGLLGMYLLFATHGSLGRFWSGWLGTIQSISLTTTTAFLVHKMAGRNFSGYWILFSAMGGGLGLFSSLPEDPHPLVLVLFSFFAGILPGAWGGWIHSLVIQKKIHPLDEILILLVFCGIGWGSFLGWVFFPILDGRGEDIGNLFQSIVQQFFYLLVFFGVTALLGWIGLGLRKLLWKIP